MKKTNLFIFENVCVEFQRKNMGPYSSLIIMNNLWLNFLMKLSEFEKTESIGNFLLRWEIWILQFTFETRSRSRFCDPYTFFVRVCLPLKKKIKSKTFMKKKTIITAIIRVFTMFIDSLSIHSLCSTQAINLIYAKGKHTSTSFGIQRKYSIESKRIKTETKNKSTKKHEKWLWKNEKSNSETLFRTANTIIKHKGGAKLRIQIKQCITR